MSQIESKVNRILGFILITQVVLSFVCGVLAGAFNGSHRDLHTYIVWSNGPALDGVLLFFTYFVLVNTMIPISLIVSIEIVKVTQSYFINKDMFMYSQLRDKHVEVKSASLNEELGQIEHIFSDKTGTLTTNRMEFKIACVGTHLYGDLALISKDSERPPQAEKGFRDDHFKHIIRHPDNPHKNTIKEVHVKDRQGNTKITFSSIKTLGEEFLKALSMAHEVVVQEDEAGRSKYQGPSPDEITLVEAARDMGFEFVKSTQEKTIIKVHGDTRTYDLLEIFSFNSDRKRMSVVIREDGLIKMYTKGADSIVKARLARGQTFSLDDELHKFSVVGLRTLLIAMRVISEEEYSAFRKKGGSLPEEGKEKAFEELVSELERELFLIGATAVLDRLQDEVPETIRDMIRASKDIAMQM
jgi:magnesium-transporting ATPase (P-type)